MFKYKLHKYIKTNPDGSKETADDMVVIKILDSGKRWFISKSEDNTDYQEYLKWVAEGNTPEPAEE